jgi:translocation and assembly module TamB
MRRTVIALLSVSLLAVVAAAGGVTWLLYSNGGARWLLGQAQDRVPGELRVERLDGSLAAGLRIDGMRYEDAAMRVDAASVWVVLRAGFGPLTLRVRDLQADGVRYRIIDDGRPAEPAEPLGSLALPLPIEVERARIERFSVEDTAGEQVFEGDLEGRFAAFEQLDIETARLESEPVTLDIGGRVGLAPPWRLALAASGELRAAIEGDDAPARLRFESEVDGPLESYRFVAAGTLAGGPLEEEHRFDLESSGSTDGLQVDALAVRGPTIQLDTGALLDWTARRLELAGLRAALPGSELEADADLTVDLATAEVAGEVNWRGFAWPLRDAPPQVQSRQGQVTIGGSLDDWTVDGRADLAAQGAPPVEAQFRATGDRHGLQAEIPEGAALGGTFGGRLTWSWEGALPLSAALRFDDIETAALAPGWPGRLGGELALAGELEPLALDVDVARVQGELRGAEVFGEGRVRLAGQRLRFDGFTLRAGDSRVTLHGDAAAAEGVAFEVEISNPGDLVPGAAGRASGQGVISLAGPSPRLSVDLEGADLAWGAYRADRLTLSNVPVADTGARSRLELEGSELAWNGQHLESVNVILDWSEVEQVLELAARQGPYGLTTRAAGRLENPEAPLGDWRWSGQLQELELSEEGTSGFRLAAPVSLEAGARSARIEDACLESPAPARFCIAAEWDNAAGVAGTVSLDHFPLDLAARRLDAGIEASQVISGTFGFTAPMEGAFSGEVELNLSPGALRYVDDPDVALETAEGYIGFSMADGRVSAGRLDVPMPGQGGIELDFEVARLAEGTASPVSGRLRAELADLDVLTLLLPAVDRMAGRLQAEFDLTGTVGDPGIDGHIALSDGVVTNLASGFSLNDLQLSGAVDADRQTRLTGQFRAVDGVGTLAAVLDLRTLYDPHVTLEIGGENLVLFDTPTLKLTATPDMRLGWRNGTVEIAGTLAIPQGRLEPKVIPMKSVGESADAEIVAGTLPERQLAEQSMPLDIQGSLDVTLGPGVTVKLPVAEASVSGNARFSWSGEPVPIGDGAFVLRGEILALGQLLEITDGTISFPGSRADNPHLNIQAEREIFGNSEIRHAGVLVAGTLKRPVIEPYTDPMTNRERARTLLVTGSDFNMERGVGTVDVGTYIAPRIFVSYGIGVFDQENVFSVRYDLGRGWGVKTTSGESQTGVDISYTVEN